MRVNIKDMITITNRILKKYQSISNEFNISNDYYWFVDVYDSYNMTSAPSDLCVGSLDDDMNKLSELLQEEREVNILDLERMSNIMKSLNFEMEILENKIL